MIKKNTVEKQDIGDTIIKLRMTISPEDVTPFEKETLKYFKSKGFIIRDWHYGNNGWEVEYIFRNDVTENLLKRYETLEKQFFGIWRKESDRLEQINKDMKSSDELQPLLVERRQEFYNDWYMGLKSKDRELIDKLKKDF